MSKMMRNYLIGLSIAIVIYAGVVGWFIKREIILPPEVIDTIILFILAAATIFYAVRTSDIADATIEQAKASKQQADASKQMAEEMREQRLAVKPFVIPDIDIYSEQRDYTNKWKGIVQEGDIPIVLTNVGTATAIELKLSLVTLPSSPESANFILQRSLPLLLPGASWRTKLDYICDSTQDGEPIWGPPSDGKYNLLVKFKSIAHNQEKQVWEVSLPFELRLPHGDFGLSIKRDELQQKLLEGAI